MIILLNYLITLSEYRIALMHVIASLKTVFNIIHSIIIDNSLLGSVLIIYNVFPNICYSSLTEEHNVFFCNIRGVFREVNILAFTAIERGGKENKAPGPSG